MASETSIASRALQMVGASSITSLNEDSLEARACKAVYEDLRDAELRAHSWNFAIRRVQLAANTVSPAFGKGYAYDLPVDFLKLIESDIEYYHKDWIIEGRKLLTNEAGPLDIRYISQVTQVGFMDPLFREALSARIASAICEQLTQSNSKKEALREDYKSAIRDARKANAFDKPPLSPAEDPWVMVRY